ncbi:MAG: hypothetical protein JWP30_1718 [Homoserinimonas sp.]|nr:hypothetical protein [Homoserinimonas sp.]
MRDGFRHKSTGAGNHKPESAFHVQGKARLALWLRSAYPRSTTTIEKPSTPARERIADVMIESPAGDKVAFEMQYASLSVADWEIRHQSYVDMGIPDVWVFGHTGKQFKATAESLLKLNELHRHIAESGALVFWLNPITGQIATAEENLYAGGRVFRVAARREGEIRLSMLDELRVTTTGVTSARFSSCRLRGERGHPSRPPKKPSAASAMLKPRRNEGSSRRKRRRNTDTNRSRR